MSKGTNKPEPEGNEYHTKRNDVWRYDPVRDRRQTNANFKCRCDSRPARTQVQSGRDWRSSRAELDRARCHIIARTATFSQSSLTIPAAMNTAPQTGGVIVAIVRTRRRKGGPVATAGPRIAAGPATETQITYAAVVGTSIPRSRHASAVNNAGQTAEAEADR